MTISAEIIKDSITEYGKRITTMRITFPRFILPEFNTHRVFSRNFSSSRAIPTAKLLEKVRTDPSGPIHWGKNQPGMQAAEELNEPEKTSVKSLWLGAANEAANLAELMSKYGAHKQIVNRLIEPFIDANGIVTSTEWDNFFLLRDHVDAQPEIRELAIQMKLVMSQSTPTVLSDDQWHLPFITAEDIELTEDIIKDDIFVLQKISAARCCRVSYNKFDGKSPSIDDDVGLFTRLAGSVPRHDSPLEHQAKPLGKTFALESSGNFRGWQQFRHVWSV